MPVLLRCTGYLVSGWYVGWYVKDPTLTNLKKDGTPKQSPKASDSDDAFPIMDLNTPIVNIHYEKYIAHSHELLKRIGVIFSRALV